MSRTSAQLRDSRTIFDVPVAALGFAQASALVLDALGGADVLRINFLNANNANLADGNPALVKALRRSVVLSDGAGLNLASRVLYGAPFPANLNGTDFVPHLLRQLPAGTRIGLVGGRPDVLAEARDGFAAIAPQLVVTAIHDGYFPQEGSAAIAARIAAVRPDILLVAMGTPRQELWADQWLDERHAGVIITVGALFDFVAQRVPRAPKLMRSLGVEWAFRLALEPRRLFKRYVVGNPMFVGRVLRQRAGLAKRSSGAGK